MEYWIVKGCVLVFLLWNGVLDARKQEVSLRSFWIFGLAGAGLNFWLKYQAWWEILGGIGVGVLLLAAAFLTREAVGFGDGLLVCVTGIYLGLWENLDLVFSGTLICALIMMAGIASRRVKRSSRFPLVPFLFLAYLGRLFR